MRVRPATALVAMAGMVATSALRARTMRAVAPELRSPALWLPMTTADRLTLAIGRTVYKHAASRAADGVEVTRYDVPGVQDVYVYRPTDSHGGALLWIHGGGTILGRPEIDHDLCSRLAHDQHVVVVSTRYRLAPEHPFPAAHDDCFAALQWIRDNADQLAVDTSRIGVGGASAGGGLAAGVVQRAVDERVPVAFQLLLYPMLDDRTTTRPASHRGKLVWTRRANTFGWAAYLGADHATRPLPEYAAPGRRADLAGLPPAWIGVGNLDLFHDEDLAYARRLHDAGTVVELLVEPGMYHAADYLKHSAPSMRAFRRSMFNAVGRALNSTT